MKKIGIYLFFIFLVNCSTSKTVYWCGDHACVNNKEKELYFKKTMTVEIKDYNSKTDSLELKNVDKDEMSNNKKIAKQLRLEEKRIKKEKKALAKQLRLEEKRIKKEKKELAKQNRLDEKKKIKLAKRIKKNKLESSAKIETTFDNDLSESKLNQDMFNDIVERIINRNMIKSYPDVNNIPN